jgi:tetratricopeptide (TPR) repeat protein
MTAAGKSIGAALMALLLLLGAAALGYARWTAPIAEGDRAVAAEQWDRALAAYGAADARFDSLPATRQLFARDYNRVAANELSLLYRLHRYDEVIQRAERAPEGASPHFWAGLASFAKARAESKPEDLLGWLTRAEEEFHQAVEAAPADWDTKYDFELVTRLVTELRKQPKTPPGQLMQLLRPQTKPATGYTRRVG